MSNSSLVTYTRLSPNHSGKRTHSIDRITPHCVVGQLSVETLGSIFAPSSRQASSNYGIGKDGRVGMYVEEKNRSWCSSSNANDQRAVTIECASDLKSPYAFNTTVWNKLIDLCVDICKRNGKKKLLWLGNKEKALNYSPKSDEMILTAHRWFSDTACPGNWMYSKEGDLAEAVTKRLGGSSSSSSSSKKSTKITLTVDGKFGSSSIKRMQQFFGVSKTGKITGQYPSDKAYLSGITQSCITWTKSGSSVVKKLQKWVGSTQDGYLGKNTIKKLQKKLGINADGSWGPATSKAFQKYLNNH